MINGETVRAIRNVRNVSQLELSRRTRILQPYLSAIELGKRILTQEQQTAILAALSVSHDQAQEISVLVNSIHAATRTESAAWAQIHEILAGNADG